MKNSKTEASEKKNGSGRKTAMEVAAAYLASRMRTISEVRKKLRDRGEFTAEEIEETVNELIELKYLDDYEYALRYYEYNNEKHRGSRRAKQELAEKGVEKSIADNAYEDYLYEKKVDEYAEARSLALRVLEDSGREFDEKLAGKIARKLDNAGFGTDDICRVLAELRKLGAEPAGDR